MRKASPWKGYTAQSAAYPLHGSAKPLSNTHSTLCSDVIGQRAHLAVCYANGQSLTEFEDVMFLKGYKKEIFRPECNPHFESLHCLAHLENDIREVIPYLNAVLGGTAYQKDPPSVMFHIYGRFITVHSNKIAINAIKDEDEADKILRWLSNEINETWEKRDSIEPSESVAEKPKLIEVLKLLPRTNCGECGYPTCTVFSSLVIQGVKGSDDCTQLEAANKSRLETYLAKYRFIDL